MILVLLLLLPFIGGAIAWLIGPRLGGNAPRWVSLFTMLAVLTLSAYLWTTGDFSGTWLGESHHWAFEYRAAWIPRFGISFHLALDGLSLLLIALTGLLGVMAVACSWREINRHTGFFHLNLLWNLGGVVGVFMAMDLFLFFFFWEMMLVPMFFLIALWGHNIPGGRDRVYAATKFFIFTQASGLLMLLSILALVFVHAHSTGILSFDYQDLLGTPMSATTGFWIMLGFFVAFMVKLPVLPFHSWLPDAHSQAPTAGSAVLAGVLLKTAGYGLLRFCLPLFPHASAQFAPVAMWLGIAGIVYGALLAFGQTDIKRLVAYTSISHMGFVLLAIYAGTQLALQGAVVNMLAHGISAGALFILSGEIYERLHTRDVRKLGGLWSRVGSLPPILMFFAVASLGLPGMGNFVGEFLILVGTYKVAPVATWFAASGLVLAAAYALILVQRSLHGVPRESDHRLNGLNRRELATMLTLMAVLLWLGLYPQTFLNTSSATMSALHHWYAGAPTTGIAAR